MTGAEFCRVAVDSPVLALDRPFDYRIPERLRGRVRPGSVVRVPLHGRRVRAFVLELVEEAAVERPQEVAAVVGREPLFSPAVLAVARWAARRYVAPLGLVLRRAAPGRFTVPPGGEGPRPAFGGGPAGPDRWGEVAEAVRASGRTVVVAPSPEAETEAVQAAVAACLGAGRRALVLAPRTAAAEELARSLGGAVVLHGDLPPAQRARAWALARAGEVPVLVGTRAAALVPLPDLGLVAAVGCHDRALKEERTPRLHALEVALQRAEAEGAALVVSSVAPPLDLAGPRAAGLRWLAPPGPAPGPRAAEVVVPRGGPVTRRLLEVVRWALGRGGDVLVFAGRRGLALRVRCEECGWFPRCEACGTGLALFGAGGAAALRCRGCGASRRPPAACAACGGVRLGGVGWGSERLVEALREAGVGTVLRAERDAPLPGSRPRPAVIVGTLAALAALPRRSLGAVCVADLDQLLGLPDFRASERAFQTLEELRGLVSPGGRVLVQTREPQHHAVQGFVRRSYRYFAARELPARRSAGYPPFGVVVRAEVPAAAVEDLAAAAAAGGAELVGPLPRPGGRAATLLRAPALEPLLGPLRELALRWPGARLDVDPMDLV